MISLTTAQSAELRRLLGVAGDRRDRDASDQVRRWAAIAKKHGLEMPDAAAAILRRLGGLIFPDESSGEARARVPIHFDPTEAIGPPDVFEEYRGFYCNDILFPIGMACHGLATIAACPHGKIFMFADFISFEGEDIDEALARLLLGLSPIDIKYLPDFE